MAYHYVFSEKEISKMKFCPYCGGKIMEIYPGDYMGHISCWDCDEDLSFYILEEMLVRFPKWIEDIKKGPPNQK